MKEVIEQRFKDLSSDGHRLTNSIPRDEYGPGYWIPYKK